MTPTRRAVLFSVCAAAAAVAGAAPVWSAAPTAPQAVPSPLRLRLLLRTGDRAPDGGTITEFSDPTNNGPGDLMFGAVVQNGARVRETLYLRPAATGTVTPLVSTGQAVPTGGTLGSFSDLLLNDHGVVGFMSRNVGRGSPEGIYVVRGGHMVPVVAVGQPAPTSTGGRFTDFANPTVNNQGVIAFIGRLAGAEGIFTSTGGRTTVALLSGQTAPDGGAFEFFLDGSPALNDHGQMAFVASTTVGHAQGVYVFVDGQPVPLVTTQDDAPLGGQFTEFGSVVLTNAGTVGFIGRTRDGKIPEALYVTGRAALVPLAVAGEDVGGGALTKFADAAIDGRENIVFQLSLPIVPQAIYLANRAGVRVLLQSGDHAPGGGQFTAFSTPTLNAAGQVAFVAETDDGRHGLYEMMLP